ncbi:hypothetical protein M422DRAFT_155829 [Sphaerobolus stellatus SS14]|nr:hypothetical protein M422DRAFT_155829 [Sphaerobolus stellatus SS14]
MNPLPTSARQPKRDPWPLERLIRERAIALGHALEPASSAAYKSHLRSYLSFCDSHNFPIHPTAETLSFYVVYMSHHLKPTSVGTYLSGICNTLEPYFPEVRDVRSSVIVTRSLAGMKKLRGLQATTRKRALSTEDLLSIISHLPSPPHHDDLLFASMLLTGFHGLLRLGELTFPDNIRKRSSKKLSLRHTLNVQQTRFSFTLPFHKADRFFAGNIVMIEALPIAIQALSHWSSDTWRIYIRKHPVLIQALIYGHSAFQTVHSSTTLSSLPSSSRN